jgi:phenylpropionate dioxygenase-like ring-hydroxylating dioxygenase large terminal subunit
MTASNAPGPGEARAEGPTVADTLQQDSRDVPAPLLEQQYEFLGDEDLPVERYISRAFFRREIEQLWPNAWQWACREEHLPEAGDSYVYDIGPYSVLIARMEDGSVKAFLNVCTHRGTRLIAAEGCSYTPAFSCPFHGWSWNLDGSVRNIPGQWDFPHTEGDSHRLAAVRCELWGGFIFINLDPDAAPLDDYLGVMKEHFSQFPLERRRIRAHVQKTLPANWKIAQEAFMEAYHNFETHDSPHGANAQYDVFSEYVSRFIHTIGSYSPSALADYPGDKWRRPPMTEQEMLAELALEGRELGVGETARQVAAQAIREQCQEQLGVDLNQCSDSQVLDSIEYHLFPNMFFFPGIMIPMVYRFRPNGDDVDSSIFDVLVLEPLPDGAQPPEPPEPTRLSVEQSYTEAPELGWLAPVYDEDTGNLELQTRGLKSSRKGLSLGNYQEARIRRVHQTLDEFMARGKPFR